MNPPPKIEFLGLEYQTHYRTCKTKNPDGTPLVHPALGPVECTCEIVDYARRLFE